MNNPIAITGIGVVSPAGTGEESFWDGLISRKDMRGSWSRGDLSRYPYDSVIEIPAHVWEEIKRGARAGDAPIARLSRFVARQALRHAKLPAKSLRIGCFLASTTAGVEALQRSLLPSTRKARVTEPRCLDAAHMLSSPGQRWNGPTSVLSTACSSGLLALGLASDVIAFNEADVMIAGSLDSLLEYTVCGFSGLRLTTDDQCRPFSSDRKGVVLSEGAACFCLEPLSNALERRADIRGVILGYGLSCDADHVTAPNPDGVGRAMAQALERSGIRPDAIAGVFAHGTGSQANDVGETAALRSLFGDGRIPPVTAIKSVMGHPQAAAGSFSLLAALLALRHGKLPPTAGLNQADPALGALDIVMSDARPLTGKHLMVNAFGFGGNNCVMVVTDLETALNSLSKEGHGRQRTH